MSGMSKIVSSKPPKERMPSTTLRYSTNRSRISETLRSSAEQCMKRGFGGAIRRLVSRDVIMPVSTGEGALDERGVSVLLKAGAEAGGTSACEDET